MISLGVDFAVHALRRYKEELNKQYPPRMALKIGLSSVIGALILAMLTDSIAFLSNLSSPIEAVIHFGSAAAIAVFASFAILGTIAPMVVMRIDELIITSGMNYKTTTYSALRLSGTLGVALSSGVAIILLVAVSKVYGVIILGASTLVFLGIPIVYMFFIARKGHPGDLDDTHTDRDLLSIPQVESLVSIAAGHSRIVLITVAFLTAGSVFFALKLEPIFDVKDFFDSNSEMVIGLDKLDEHVGDNGGEPGAVYVKGDLMDPSAVETISGFIESLRDIDQIAEIVEKNMRTRIGQKNSAEEIIKEELPVLEASMKRLEAEPVVKDVFKNIDSLRIKELQKALNMLGSLDDDKKKIIDNLSKAIVESIVTTPMNNLRKHTEQGNTELLDAVEKLFEYKKDN